MDPAEYLSFLPLLIYGIAIADLLSQWKRLFISKDFFLPYSLLTIVLTEVALYNVFIYVDVVNKLVGLSYFHYLLYLCPPFLFMLATNVFTPDKRTGTKEYFMRTMPKVFILLALFVSSQFLFNIPDNIYLFSLRILFVVLILITGMTKKLWLFYVMVALWLFAIFLREYLTN